MSVTKHKRPKARGKATSQQTLGSPPDSQQVRPKWRRHFERLLKLRDHLLKQQKTELKQAVDESPTYSMHMADAGTDSYDRDLSLGLLSHEQNALYEVDEALNRIREGTYGKCEMTGKIIPAKRLEAIPWTRFTAEAEKTLEEKGEVEHAQLGTLQSVVKEPPPQEPEFH
jgi:DnaK suppressor protein